MDIHIRKGNKSDCRAIWTLINELAVYEKAPEEMELSIEELENDGFGENPAYQVLVAEMNSEIIGMALYYQKYSTWKGKSIYLEDLIVTEKHRGKGAGKLLFEAVIKECSKKNAGRMEWQVLNWNRPALDFYKSYGAELDDEWINGKFRRDFLQKQESK